MNLKEEIDLNLKKSIRYCTRMEIWDYQILKWILLIIVTLWIRNHSE
jgi:hypothetical protein